MPVKQYSFQHTNIFNIAVYKALIINAKQL